MHFWEDVFGLKINGCNLGCCYLHVTMAWLAQLLVDCWSTEHNVIVSILGTKKILTVLNN